MLADVIAVLETGLAAQETAAATPDLRQLAARIVEAKAALEEALHAGRREHEAAQARLQASHRDAVAALQATIERGEAAVAALNVTVAQLESERDGLAARLAAAEASHREAVAALQATIERGDATLQATIERHEAAAATLSATVATLRSERDATTARLTAAEASHREAVAALQATIERGDTTLKATIERHEAEVAALSATIATLRSERDGLAAQLAGAQAEHAAARSASLAQVAALEETQRYVHPSLHPVKQTAPASNFISFLGRCRLLRDELERIRQQLPRTSDGSQPLEQRVAAVVAQSAALAETLAAAKIAHEQALGNVRAELATALAEVAAAKLAMAQLDKDHAARLAAAQADHDRLDKYVHFRHLHSVLKAPCEGG